MTDDGHLVEVRDLPTVKIKVGEGKRTRLVPSVLAAFLRERSVVHAFLEDVGPMPNDGAVQSFNLGRSFGQIEGALAAAGLAYTMVRPQVWKRDLSLGRDKSASRARACQLWPGAAASFARVKDDGRAEAALIALHGSGRMHGLAAFAA
ncbi:hypothetical protein [Roseomonas indoligenes]|uniref:Uncharacterized protein n=1 Tax=Roseomonas indoligenes TaxID=2820811 RepID=A0A940MRM0_9PROT|nr:hypothetical protein [Pararoseomonas indoligenes]MBP0492199.1 hypothetical protein [Pararoseomonas indoligenes]